MLSRRTLLKSTLALAGMSAISRDLLADPVSGSKVKSRFNIGACDWSIQKANSVEAMELASRIGLDGVQLSLGTVDNDMHLRRKDMQEAYKAAGKKHGVRIGGLAIGELNNIPYKSDPRTEAWVSDSIDVAKAIGVKTVLLAFFHKGDLKNDPEGQKVVIERLRKVAPKAEKQGIILGIESWLSAQEHVDIIQAVGSKNVQVYYDVANSHQMGYNIYEEIRWLGKNQICEIHAKENGYLLGQGKIDFKEVRKAIDDIGYTGWVQIEGAIPEKKEVLESYQQNNQFLRGIFPESKRS
ncbi:sugar phosphate isomerase/epimerase family protein [Rhodocytophaga aerolata]|uniref:Sugar phosphate isomerase/epimerase family protein n=1 Tax=Rhodocytophaga aerolata TaxID=455078 RepID=A0ABT8R8L2_9BACT|nr:sugar phosphate isomerase/epimerase family protein [Rhodocytophaga aerolata]MDO1448439.1 sugar phosphate isomerase/epimerase family protein [Rhodocytophaga aerolata]